MELGHPACHGVVGAKPGWQGDALDSIQFRLQPWVQAESLSLVTVPVQLEQTYEPLAFCDAPHLVPLTQVCPTSTSRQAALIAMDPGEEAALLSSPLSLL